MADIAVVILNYNGEKYLEQFLPSVVQHSSAADVVIVDNASTDQSIALLTASYPHLQLIQLEKNLGYAGGYNMALAQLTHEYCILLNSDIEVTPGWISPVIDFMQQNPTVAACQPKILDFHHRHQFEYAGASGGFLDAMGFPYCRGRIFDTLETDEGQYDDTRAIFWATGACLFVRRRHFMDVEGFDADFFAHMEEIDLCWRLQLRGWAIYCVPESKVFHVGGGTLHKINPQKTYLNFRNNLSLLFKNESSGSLWWKLPLKLLLDWAAGFKFAWDYSWRHFGAVLKAHLHFWLDLPQNVRKRKIIQQSCTQPVYNSPLLLPYQYYIKGKKTFRQLHP